MTLIFLASAWGWYPDVDLVRRIEINAAVFIPIALLGGFCVWHYMKSVWPKDKW